MRIQQIFILALFMIAIISCKQEPEKLFAEQLFEAHLNVEKLPQASDAIERLSIEKAYEIQKEFINKRKIKERIVGYKAGLTSIAGQQKFNINEPLAGVLFFSGLKENNAIINSSDFADIFMEVEIGFILKQEIREQVANVEDLKGLIDKVIPVVEFPDMGYENMNTLNGLDLIAGNVASAQFIIGRELNPEDFILDSVSVQLKKDSEIIINGRGSDALGSQWDAALWLTNKIISLGYRIEKGNIIMTGGLGKMVKGEKGDYMADFGELGTINFKIE